MKRQTDKQRGISLVEVMVALALGLIVSVGAMSLMLGNRQSYRTTEALARVQEATRITFDLMSRDLRAAGINACSGGVRVMNLLADPATPRWWTDWTGGLRGFNDSDVSTAVTVGTAALNRVANTDMIELMHASTTAFPVKVHNASAAEATLAELTVPARSIALEKPGGQGHSFVAGDLLVVCDYEDTTLFQVTGVNADANSVSHAARADVAVTPGNCANTMGFRPNCASVVTRSFQPGSQVMRFEPVAWFVGNNGRTGSESSPTSLYRIRVVNDGAGNAAPVVEEVVEGVRNMQLLYMYDRDDEYKLASAVTDWRLVTGVEIQLTIESPESGTTTSTTQPRLTRTLTHVVNLRNRVP
ncbi:PilW family protein [Methyloversatilis discipulorum]|uniref:PilW family protein n=1 Tax=Methyloversatilis discipulorum TaxID=1119528 RepID=UPI001A57B664|nr:prepilin-type N-terminal cleavage/methylation domain-containing protein [Methyloversatilis discipulorum]MBL8466356.1 prepilin-type N-terminal cleavage/methylation domain-containing protein [Methyloversatilis discipulorum]